MEISKDIEKKVKNWVSEQRKKGVSDSSIKSALMEKEYPRELINKIMRKGGFFAYFLVAFVVIIIAVGIYFLIPVVQSLFVSCNTADCFIAKAENCGSARIDQTIGGSVFRLSVEKCILTKTLSKINETEPQEMKDLLGGKSMTCAYSSGMFDDNWIKTLSIGIEDCSGDLKDAIDELTYSL
jgi:hypothetical protein